MPMSCTNYHRPYDGLIFGLPGMAAAMLAAGGIRSHSNAWDDYGIFKKVHAISSSIFLYYILLFKS